MAELVLGAFISVAIEKLASAALEKYARSIGIHSQLKKLKTSLSQIQALLNDASDKEQTNESVKQWLNRLQHLAYDIDDVLDALATEEAMQSHSESQTITSRVKKLIPTCCTTSCFPITTGMHHKLDDINSRLQDLEKETLTIGLIVKIDQRPKKLTNRKNETSLPEDRSAGIVGREGEKKALLRKLMEDEPCKEKFNIIPIVGMGGVGKTTLARLLYNDNEVTKHFDIKAWVCVSDEFNIFFISQVLYQSITGENKEFKDLNLLQEALSEKLKEKQFLIVLDDVWSESYVDWETLVRPFHSGAPGSKVIMTTRKDGLLKKLGYDHLDRVESLSSDDALSLLAQHALGMDNFDSHPTLKALGLGIVKKCGGLPLAVKVIGRLLRKNSDDEDWEDVLNNEIWESHNGDEIVPALRLSYHDLPAHLKQLFAYCSLFPKDYLFDKEELVLLWMSEGFLQQSKTKKSTERTGSECFNELLSRSFFQHAPSEEALYVMHDLMNDLATSVAVDFFSRLDIGVKKEFMRDALEMYRHMSFVCENYITYEKFKPFKEAKKLRSFLVLSPLNTKEIWRRFYMSNKVLANLLHELPLLRVLSLSHLGISEVPESVGCLKHLRYLNLSRTDITHLPENVCGLHNLQTLIVSGCGKLTEFPNSFLKLKNLRQLDIRNTNLLNKMPIGIGELKNLRILVSNISIEDDVVFVVTRLKELTDFQGELRIKGLEKVQNPVHAQELNLSQKRLNHLELAWNGVFDDGLQTESVEKEVLNVLMPRKDSLKKLVIKNYGGKIFPEWVGDVSFLQLVGVRIEGCKKCTSLPPFGQLPLLKKLHIEGMDGMKSVGLELLGNANGHAFPSLESLSFVNMKGLEVWFTNTNIPCLEELCIQNCHSLVEMSVEALLLPSLRDLQLRELPSLNKLSIGSMYRVEERSTKSGVVDAAFPCLERLFIKDCPKLVEISVEAQLPSLRYLYVERCGDGLLRSLVRMAPSSITKLEINDISGLTDEVWGSVMEHFEAVEEVQIQSCNEIRYLWELETKASKALVNLTELEVYGCSNLARFQEKKEDKSASGSNILLSSLRILTVLECKNMERCICPNSIEILHISGCDSLTSVSFPSGGGQNLKMLFIENCKKLVLEKKTKLLINNTSDGIPILESVSMFHLENLESIFELRSYVYLAYLEIAHCPNLKSFPDHELQNLSSLKHLVIRNCQRMDASFPRGLWPPNLSLLNIGGLKKPISEWGPQNFPTSLVDLTLWGSPEEEGVSRWSELMSQYLLPSSVTSLQINGFEKLESVSMLGVQHLTSLQRLTIWNCPKLKDLPESKTLYSSLLRLEIIECPNLSERCRGRGSHYWPLIAHIPYVYID